MAPQVSKNGNNKITLYLIVNQSNNYVNPSIYIEVNKGENIRFKDIETKNDDIAKDSFKPAPGSKTTITYETYSAGNDGFMFHDISHVLPNLPHEIEVVVNPGVGGTSTVKDVALPT